MRPNPIGHELARHDNIERSAVRLEGAELGRLQPAVERACAEIPAKSGANRLPGCFDRGCDGSPGQFGRIRPTLHWSAPPRLSPLARGKGIPLPAIRVARLGSLFSLAPGTDSRPERPFCD